MAWDNDPVEYAHTQYGYTGLLTTAFMIAVGWASVPETFAESPTAGWLFVTFVAAIVALTFWFSRLVVTVENDEIKVAFGLGKPHRVIQLSEVRDVRQVRNNWIQGWGVRKISHGWMYNVWGLDAVELEMVPGEIFRVGTDEPEQLHTAIALSTHQ